jgi:dihydrofolate reductase
MRRIRYSVAMSLDGYIAGPNGEYDWIELDPSAASGYFKAFYAQFDTALMGRKSYEQAGGAVSPFKTCGRRIKLVPRAPELELPGYTLLVYDVQKPAT